MIFIIRGGGGGLYIGDKWVWAASETRNPGSRNERLGLILHIDLTADSINTQVLLLCSEGGHGYILMESSAIGSG